MLRRETKEKFGEDSSQYRFFDGVATHTEGLAKDRNLWVHGMWGYGTKPGERRKVFAVSYWNKVTGKGGEVTEAGLTALAMNITKLSSVIENGIPKHLRVPVP